MKPRLAVFDFDGTITNKDTFIELIKYYGGKKIFYLTLFLFSPYLLLWKLHLYPNWKIKQKIFSYYFKGMALSRFKQICESFTSNTFETIIFSQAKKQIDQHLENNDTVIIVSASVNEWVKEFASKLGINKILATEIETDENNMLTGNFHTKNCYGKEKIKRLYNEFPNLSSYYMIAYGNSRGDFDLLKIADKANYKIFNK